MKISPSGLLDHARSDEGRKQLRYAGVSLVFVPVGQVLIQVLAATAFAGNKNNFTWASITAAAILTLPNFFANKYLVWKQTSSDNLRTQVLVFWVAAMLGVTFATGLTFLVEGQVHDKVAGWVEALCVFFAQLVGFGIVWIGRYLILDKWLFKVTHHGQDPDDDELEMMHGDLPI
ncbi:MAG: GtrA family protein [Microthrixaceae bacterium]